jgi:hypothetical protein
MKKKFVVSYEIDYVHRVSVGIEAMDQAEAKQIAEQAFNEALIWDDTEAMPLLSDEYHGVRREVANVIVMPFRKVT